MSEIFNVFCDESRHLENNGQNVMALGLMSLIWKAATSGA